LLKGFVPPVEQAIRKLFTEELLLNQIETLTACGGNIFN
jgi:hypothetical protein